MIKLNSATEKRGEKTLLNAKCKSIRLSIKYQKKTRTLWRGRERKYGWGNGGQRWWRHWPMGHAWPAVLSSDGSDSEGTHQSGGRKRGDHLTGCDLQDPGGSFGLGTLPVNWREGRGDNGEARGFSPGLVCFGGNKPGLHLGPLFLLCKNPPGLASQHWGRREGWEKGQGPGVETEPSLQVGREWGQLWTKERSVMSPSLCVSGSF